MALIAPAAIGVIAIMRRDLFGRRADLHGSARWATSRDVRRAGLLPQRTVVRRLGRYLLRIRSQTHSAGIYLARWQGSSRIRFLRDTGPGHVLVFAPTRSGKDAGVVVPTLLTWPHSALIHDFNGENWALTAGWRKRMGHVCLKFDPTDTTGTSVKYNPLEQVRLRTEHEAEDVQNIVHMIVAPDGRGLNDHWVKTGSALLAGFAYVGPDLNSSSPEELASLTQHVNSALARFGDGWMLNVDLIRHESASYPEDCEFPDPTTRLIERERQIHYTAERRHFETRFALTTTFRPPPDLHRRAARLFFSDNAAATDWSRILDSFEQTVAEFQDALSASLRVVRMDDATLLTHLNACITGPQILSEASTCDGDTSI